MLSQEETHNYTGPYFLETRVGLNPIFSYAVPILVIYPIFALLSLNQKNGAKKYADQQKMRPNRMRQKCHAIRDTF